MLRKIEKGFITDVHCDIQKVNASFFHNCSGLLLFLFKNLCCESEKTESCESNKAEPREGKPLCIAFDLGLTEFPRKKKQKRDREKRLKQ